MPTQLEIKTQLPKHLQQFVAEQDYVSRYSAKDQVVWRFVMSRLTKQLKDTAHPIYFEGLAKVGIALDRIPSIEAMNLCLAKLGWRAIVVDGFIPPQAFMELQALKVLAIAVEIRSVEHIEYTPAPDIIHEAAGHAPIIADEEYSDYLSRFGAVGQKAISNEWDEQMYLAVRDLSILKEDVTATTEQIDAAEAGLKALAENPGKPSELALLSRLHWWTVEYGLVGDVDSARIFGAGLLSSMQESKTCLKTKVEKIRLTTDAIMQSYDITRAQPKLYVTKSCRHLSQVLEEFSNTMCWQRGGLSSMHIAIASKVVNTAVYSSGLQVAGKFSRCLSNAIDQVIYIATAGRTQLAVKSNELDGHGVEYHSVGFGSPVGRVCNLMKPLEEASEYELQALNIRRDSEVAIEFLSGVKLSGYLQRITKVEDKIVLMSFSNCTVVAPDGELLFEPSWGDYDMAVGEAIESVSAGSADREHFDVYPVLPQSHFSQAKTDVAKAVTDDEIGEQFLYGELADCTVDSEGGVDLDALNQVIKKALLGHKYAWLIFVEALRFCQADARLREKILNHLDWLKQHKPEIQSVLSSYDSQSHDSQS